MIELICQSKNSLKIFGSWFAMQRSFQGAQEHYADDVPEFRMSPNADDILLIHNSSLESCYLVSGFKCSLMFVELLDELLFAEVWHHLVILQQLNK